MRSQLRENNLSYEIRQQVFPEVCSILGIAIKSVDVSIAVTIVLGKDNWRIHMYFLQLEEILGAYITATLSNNRINPFYVADRTEHFARYKSIEYLILE